MPTDHARVLDADTAKNTGLEPGIRGRASVSVDERLRERVAAVERRLEALEQGAAARRLRTGDRDALARILPAVAGGTGSDWTTIAELRSHRAAGIQIVLDGWTPKQLGGLFRRALGVPIDGYVLEQGDREHGARCWRILGSL